VGNYFEISLGEPRQQSTPTQPDCSTNDCIYLPLTATSRPELPAGQAWMSYYSAGGQRAVMRVQSNQAGLEDGVFYFLSDHLGSTSLTLDEGAGKVAELRYSAWGETRYTDGSTPTQRRYTGQLEAEAGLYYYQARWYDPGLGRFAQADSIIPLASQGVLAWDRYAYVNNNPVRFNDPTGHDRDCGIGDSYCSDLRREYHYSDWQKHLTFENFQRGRDAYYYYYQNPGKAFQDSYQGAEKESIMWARIYSEDVLHRLFEPIPDFMVLDKLDAARDTNNLSVFWKFFVGLGIQQFLSSDKGFGSTNNSGRSTPLNLKEMLALEATMADPLSGKILPLTMLDPRWPATAGWVKMAQNINGVEIHYLYNTITGQFAGFKFK
jgi:RHS repeat-associated protein